MPITTRAAKGAALTHGELDGNFQDLDSRATAAVAAIAAKQNSLGVADASALNALVDNRAGTVANAAIAPLAPISALSVLPINNQTGATYTLVLSDAGVCVKRTNASANTTTVPPNSAVPFPIGTVIQVMQGGAGATTVSGTGAAVVVKPSTRASFATSAQYESISLHKQDTDLWVVVAS